MEIYYFEGISSDDLSVKINESGITLGIYFIN